MIKNKKDVIELIKNHVKEIDPLAEVILYGSRARGEERSDSDWDILILTGYSVSLDKEKEFRHHLFDLELMIEEPFSIIVYSKKDWEEKMKITPFYDNVISEGIRL
ncbi:MAG: nucleotidyltransferase domain-containing protein [Bacteroidales bacterium]